MLEDGGGGGEIRVIIILKDQKTNKSIIKNVSTQQVILIYVVVQFHS